MSDDTSRRSPHDRYFKSGFSDPDVVRDYLKNYLPPSVTQLIDFTALRAEPSEYIDENLKSQFSDLLFSCSLLNSPALCYFLFEHKSKPSRETRLYLLKLMVRIWERWWEEHPGAPLPVILTLVVNQGPSPWIYSPEWSELHGLPDEAISLLAPHILDFEHHLLDLAKWELEDLRGGPFLKVFLGLIKTARTGTLEDWFKRMDSQLEVFAKGSPHYKFLKMTMNYLLHLEVKGQPGVRPELTKWIKDENFRNEMITLEQAIKEEGIQKGIDQGRELGINEGRELGINEGRELGINEGRELGINEGIHQGLQRGKVLGQIELCRQILGLSEDAGSLELLELSELEKRLAELKSQISERG